MGAIEFMSHALCNQRTQHGKERAHHDTLRNACKLGENQIDAGKSVRDDIIKNGKLTAGSTTLPIVATVGN